MLFIIKIITSSLMIVLVTEIAKKYTLAGGFIAAFPINILITLFWLYIEKKDFILLSNFAQSAFWGLFPTMFFLLVITMLFSKNNPFFYTILAGLSVLCLVVFLQYKFFINI
jgi:hypothetical protein